MINKIIECVPNFSEGRSKDIIKQITAEIKNIDMSQMINITTQNFEKLFFN